MFKIDKYFELEMLFFYSLAKSRLSYTKTKAEITIN